VVSPRKRFSDARKSERSETELLSLFDGGKRGTWVREKTVTRVSHEVVAALFILFVSSVFRYGTAVVGR